MHSGEVVVVYCAKGDTVSVAPFETIHYTSLPSVHIEAGSCRNFPMSEAYPTGAIQLSSQRRSAMEELCQAVKSLQQYLERCDKVNKVLEE